jgi:heat shock protein HslJ
VATNAENYMKGLPFLKFNANGKLSGSTGCNSFNGDYTLESNNLKLTPGAMSKMMCPGTGERDFLSGLKDAASANIKGEVLSVANSAGEEIMKFVKQPDEK